MVEGKKFTPSMVYRWEKETVYIYFTYIQENIKKLIIKCGLVFVP